MGEPEPRSMQAQLEAPFDPAEVDFRPADRGDQVVAFIDGEAVIRRLNAVYGADGWSFDWDALVIAPGQPRKQGGTPPPHDVIWVAKGRLMIGGVLHADIGDADANETSKAAVTDALKRCATHLGIGLYLRSLPRMTARIVDYVIPADEKTRLRKLLPRPDGAPPAPDAERIRPADLAQIRSAVTALGWSSADATRYLAQFGVARFGELTAAQAAEVVPDLLAKAADVQGEGAA